MYALTQRVAWGGRALGIFGFHLPIKPPKGFSHERSWFFFSPPFPAPEEARHQAGQPRGEAVHHAGPSLGSRFFFIVLFGSGFKAPPPPPPFFPLGELWFFDSSCRSSGLFNDKFLPMKLLRRHTKGSKFYKREVRAISHRRVLLGNHFLCLG